MRFARKNDGIVISGCVSARSVSLFHYVPFFPVSSVICLDCRQNVGRHIFPARPVIKANFMHILTLPPYFYLYDLITSPELFLNSFFSFLIKKKCFNLFNLQLYYVCPLLRTIIKCVFLLTFFFQ